MNPAEECGRGRATGRERVSTLSDDHLIRLPSGKQPVGFTFRQEGTHVVRIVPKLDDGILYLQLALLGKTVKKIKLVIAGEQPVATEIEHV